MLRPLVTRANFALSPLSRFTFRRIVLGSSPRVRGAVGNHRLVVVLHGIIPARAGGSKAVRAVGFLEGDHPRACGEQRLISVAVLSLSGSSPRVRGAVGVVDMLSDVTGIIPARAGSSFFFCSGSVPSRDHPRACGEQNNGTKSYLGFSGSSPRVRGAVQDAQPLAAQHGIIPARAGSSLRSLSHCPS